MDLVGTLRAFVFKRGATEPRSRRKERAVQLVLPAGRDSPGVNPPPLGCAQRACMVEPRRSRGESRGHKRTVKQTFQLAGRLSAWLAGKRTKHRHSATRTSTATATRTKHRHSATRTHRHRQRARCTVTRQRAQHRPRQRARSTVTRQRTKHRHSATRTKHRRWVITGT